MKNYLIHTTGTGKFGRGTGFVYKKMYDVRSSTAMYSTGSLDRESERQIERKERFNEATSKKFTVLKSTGFLVSKTRKSRYCRKGV